MTKKAVRKIKKFDFTSEGAHVALVDEAANGQSVLVMKSLKASEEEIKKALSKDVQVSMTIMEFLTRYLNIYYSDAEVVAGLMGYSAKDIDEGHDAYRADTWAEVIEEKLSNIQISKSAEPDKVKPFEQFLEKFSAFGEKYLEKNLTSSVESEGEDVVTKAEDGTQKTNEEVEMTQEEIQEMIAKAAGDLAKEQVEAIEKAYAEKAEQTEKELTVLKAAHESRVHQEYLAKAAELAAFVGETADKEAIAKALRAVEAIEEAAPLMEVLKALKDTAAKDDLFEEVGKSATEEQPSDLESKAEIIAKSYQEQGMSEAEAFVKAYREAAASL